MEVLSIKNTTCLKEFAKYSSLNVLGMLGLSCYILADTFFVAKGLGANGLTALNLAIPMYSFINGSGLMLGMGGAIKYAILQSQKETDNANRVFTNTILLALGFSVLFFVMGAFFAEPIATALGADEAVFQMSKTYLQVMLLFAPMFLFNNVLLCFVRNDGSPHRSMMAMIGGSLSNVVLDYLFIFPCKMGIFGAALATGFAPIISMFILSPFFLKRRNRFHFTGSAPSRQFIRTIFSGGLPSLLAEVSSGTVMIVFNIIILQLNGNIGVAAYGIIANLSLVVMAIYTGIAQGIQPLVSSNYGTGHTANVQSILRYAFILTAAVSIVIYLCVFLGASGIVSAFNSERHLQLESIAVTGIKIYFIGCIFAGCNMILSAYFTSTEHALPAQVISLLRGFFIMIPMAFLLSSLGGMIGVWCVFPTTELIVCGIGVILYVWHSKNRI